MLTSSRLAFFTIVAFLICSRGVFAQHIDSDAIPSRTGVPEARVPVDVLMDGEVSLTKGEVTGPNPVYVPSLHEAANRDAATVSVTTLEAPQNAMRSYKMAKEAFSKTRLDIAERELKKATTIYPQFAVAWTLLARVHENQARLEQAKADYTRALSADSRLIRPYRRLAEIAFENKKWQDVVQLTNEVIRIHSSDVPIAYLYNAAANFNMGNLDTAEMSGRRFESLDVKHLRPQAYLLLGDILQQKGEYQEAARQMKTFLTIVPNDPFADAIRKEAERLEQMSPATQHTSHSKVESK